MGSLLIAVASFLHAKQSGGRWLVRIEDIDPPREVRGAADEILRTLEAFELPWDGPVLHQSMRFAAYAETARGLVAAGLAFRCSCSRSMLGERSGRYPGTCRAGHRANQPTSVRVRVEPCVIEFTDGLQGVVETRLDAQVGDYVIERRDGLPAYHLAVVLDDAAQGITDVLRGVDLLDSTAVHIHLQRTLGVPTPRYWHAPVIVNAGGQKLSKQTGASPVRDLDRRTAAAAILRLLGAEPPGSLRGARPAELWEWAIGVWDAAALRGRRALAEPNPQA